MVPITFLNSSVEKGAGMYGALGFVFLLIRSSAPFYFIEYILPLIHNKCRRSCTKLYKISEDWRKYYVEVECYLLDRFSLLATEGIMAAGWYKQFPRVG
jgi:hypothetical protein